MDVSKNKAEQKEKRKRERLAGLYFLQTHSFFPRSDYPMPPNTDKLYWIEKCCS